MYWFLAALKNYTGFFGRAQRREYWYFYLFSTLISISLIIVDHKIGLVNARGYGLPSGIYALLAVIPGLAVTVRRFHDALPTHMKPIVEFALSTGCRAGEILGLEWSRVDLIRRVGWLDHGTRKSGDGRGIPLNADAVAALESTRGRHPRWCFTFSGKRIQQSSTAWGLAKQRAGIEDFRFHDLRHTWASWHVQSGTSLPELMELGTWKSYEMMLRHAHLAPEKLSFVAGRIERQPSRPSRRRYGAKT